MTRLTGKFNENLYLPIGLLAAEGPDRVLEKCVHLAATMDVVLMREDVADPLGVLKVAGSMQGHHLLGPRSAHRIGRSAGDRSRAARGAGPRNRAGHVIERLELAPAPAAVVDRVQIVPVDHESVAQGQMNRWGRSWSGAPGTLPPSAASKRAASGSWPRRYCAPWPACARRPAHRYGSDRLRPCPLIARLRADPADRATREGDLTRWSA
jgi:hypothetical protein